MPAPHQHQPVSVDSPAAMLAVVPHLLGFTPTHSLVIAGGRGPRHRIDVTLRFDLPDPGLPGLLVRGLLCCRRANARNATWRVHAAP
jgi:hypothetical protein